MQITVPVAFKSRQDVGMLGGSIRPYMTYGVDHASESCYLKGNWSEDASGPENAEAMGKINISISCQYLHKRCPFVLQICEPVWPSGKALGW